jgi:putative MFS transporter
MSAADIDSGFDHLAATRGGPDEISRRLESLPASFYLWRLVILLSLGGWFEVYDLFFTGYIAPGLNRSGLLTTTTQAFFGFSGIGAFVAATFAGLFVGTFALGFLADRFGRRSIFTFALLGYTAASAAMACQTTSEGVLLWRFIAGIGIGVEIITIDAYITELVPSWMRGRAFAVNQAIMFTAVPVVAALAWWLVPLSPHGVDGWRWVVLIGAAGSMVIWICACSCRKARSGSRATAEPRRPSRSCGHSKPPPARPRRVRKQRPIGCQHVQRRRQVMRSCSSRRICRLLCCS